MASEKIKNCMALDLAAETQRITQSLRTALASHLHRRGLVIAMSGGIDSSVVAALCVEAVGPQRVYGLMLPETDSSSSSLDKAKAVADKLGLKYEVQNIAPALQALGCYDRRDEAMRRVIPGYGKGWTSKIVITGGLQGRYNHFDLVVRDPNGKEQRERLPLQEYLQIVAATNYKQRIRKSIEYFHADRLNYAVAGTPNRLEYDQGFFVKNGDGAADIKPISHLYKTQVYALAAHFDLPEKVRSAAPTTDTYSLPQGQDEFYFALPYAQMDVALWAHNHKIPAADLARQIGITEEQASRVYVDIEAKRRAAAYLHSPGLVVADITV